jgi:hypothetical protein
MLAMYSNGTKAKLHGLLISTGNLYRVEDSRWACALPTVTPLIVVACFHHLGQTIAAICRCWRADFDVTTQKSLVGWRPGRHHAETAQPRACPDGF